MKTGNQHLASCSADNMMDEACSSALSSQLLAMPHGQTKYEPGPCYGERVIAVIPGIINLLSNSAHISYARSTRSIINTTVEAQYKPWSALQSNKKSAEFLFALCDFKLKCYLNK